MASTPEILVAGGGIGGLSAALALAREGRRVRVLEKASVFGEIGYGIQMGPNVYPILERLGVFERMAPHVVYPDALILADAITGDELSRINLGAKFRARFTHPYFVVHRRDLHGSILEACREPRGDRPRGFKGPRALRGARTTASSSPARTGRSTRARHSSGPTACGLPPGARWWATAGRALPVTTSTAASCRPRRSSIAAISTR